MRYKNANSLVSSMVPMVNLLRKRRKLNCEISSYMVYMEGKH
jgi:hypothetical protein